MPCKHASIKTILVLLHALLYAWFPLVDGLGLDKTYYETVAIVPQKRLVLTSPSAQNLRKGALSVQPSSIVPSKPTRLRTISRDPTFMTKVLKATLGNRYVISPSVASSPSQSQRPASPSISFLDSTSFSPGTHSLVPSPPTNYYDYQLGLPMPLLPQFAPLQQSQSGEQDNWGYDDMDSDTYGPSFWTSVYPMCGERFQSPVDISSQSVSYAPLEPLYLDAHDEILPMRLRNSGSAVSLKPVRGDTILHGGNLPGIFILSDVHFHWGRSDSMGSEHRMEGKGYPLEMHIVGYNSKYRNQDEAFGEEDGIHAMAIFFEVTPTSNVALDLCFSNLPQILFPGNAGPPINLNMTRIMPPASVPYYRYRGSLTTPPCTQNVIWTVYQSPQVISKQQLNMFRQVSLAKRLGSDGSNSRPVQSLNNRIVFTNNARFFGK